MRVSAVERGDRPATLTKARQIAPVAAKYIAKLLEEQDFATSAVVVLDWSGDWGWTEPVPMPEEWKVPIMYVAAEKWYPSINKWLTVDYRLELEDFFGKDNATKDDLHEIVENLEEKIRLIEKEKEL